MAGWMSDLCLCSVSMKLPILYTWISLGLTMNWPIGKKPWGNVQEGFSIKSKPVSRGFMEETSLALLTPRDGTGAERSPGHCRVICGEQCPSYDPRMGVLQAGRLINYFPGVSPTEDRN